MDRDLYVTTALYLLCIAIMLIVAHAFIRRLELRIEWSKQCFEQTGNAECWGIDGFVYKPKRGK